VQHLPKPPETRSTPQGGRDPFELLGLVIIVLRTSLIRIAGHWKTSRSQALAQVSSERENQRRKKLAGASNVEDR